MKDILLKEYKQRLKLVLKSKLNGKNEIMAINIQVHLWYCDKVLSVRMERSRIDGSE